MTFAELLRLSIPHCQLDVSELCSAGDSPFSTVHTLKYMVKHHMVKFALQGQTGMKRGKKNFVYLGDLNCKT